MARKRRASAIPPHSQTAGTCFDAAHRLPLSLRMLNKFALSPMIFRNGPGGGDAGVFIGTVMARSTKPPLPLLISTKMCGANGVDGSVIATDGASAGTNPVESEVHR